MVNCNVCMFRDEYGVFGSNKVLIVWQLIFSRQKLIQIYQLSHESFARINSEWVFYTFATGISQWRWNIEAIKLCDPLSSVCKCHLEVYTDTTNNFTSKCKYILSKSKFRHFWRIYFIKFGFQCFVVMTQKGNPSQCDYVGSAMKNDNCFNTDSVIFFLTKNTQMDKI